MVAKKLGTPRRKNNPQSVENHPQGADLRVGHVRPPRYIWRPCPSAQSAGARTTRASRSSFRHIPSHSTGSNVPAARPESSGSTRRRPSRCSYPRSRRSAPVQPCAGLRQRPPLRSRRDGPWRRLPRSRSRPARSRSQQGSACSQPEAQRRSISPLALRESPTWWRPLSTQRGARSTCLPPHSRTRLRLFRSPRPRRQSFFRTRRTVPPTWHSIRPRSLRPLPGCTPSSRARSRRLNSLPAGSRFRRSRRLSRSCPRRLPIPGLPRPRHHRSRRQPARTGRTPRRSQSRGRPGSRRRRRSNRPLHRQRLLRSNRRLHRQRLLRSSRRNPWPRRALPCRTPPPSSSKRRRARERRRARISRTSRSPRRRLLRLRLRRRRPRRRRPLPRRRHRPPPRRPRRRGAPRPRRRPR